MTRPSVRRLVAENTVAQMTAMAVSLGFSLVTAAILSRHLGVDRFGYSRLDGTVAQRGMPRSAIITLLTRR